MIYRVLHLCAVVIVATKAVVGDLHVRMEVNGEGVSGVAMAPADETRGYDFVLDIPDDLSSIGRGGWGIYVAPEALVHLNNHTTLRDISITSIMGYFAKGKTFVARELYNAGVESKLFWFAKSQKKLDAATGKGVTTKGISGILTRYPSDRISEARMLVLDFAGRNAPAKAWGNSSTALRNGISNLRAKERLADYVAMKISDLIIYVLDEVLNEDQQAIDHILQEIFKGNSRSSLVVVHNMKRLHCGNTEEVEAIAKEMIQDAFGAQPIPGESGLAEHTLWRSRWVDDRTAEVAYVYHFLVFDHDKCKAVNDKTFKFISDFKFSRVEAKHVRDAPPLEYLRRHIEEVLPDYLYISDEPSINQINLGNDTADSANYARLIVDGGENLRTKPWEGRFMPSTGEFKPTCEVSTDDSHHRLRVDISGIKRRVQDNEVEPENESWFRFKISRKLVSGSYIQHYIIEGKKRREPDFPHSSMHGKFHIEVPVDFYFDQRDIDFSAGCLLIVSSNSAVVKISPRLDDTYFGAAAVSAAASAVGGLISYLFHPFRRGAAVPDPTVPVLEAEAVLFADPVNLPHEDALPQSVNDTDSMPSIVSASGEIADAVADPAAMDGGEIEETAVAEETNSAVLLDLDEEGH